MAKFAGFMLPVTLDQGPKVGTIAPNTPIEFAKSKIKEDRATRLIAYHGGRMLTAAELRALRSTDEPDEPVLDGSGQGEQQSPAS